MSYLAVPGLSVGHVSPCLCCARGWRSRDCGGWKRQLGLYNRYRVLNGRVGGKEFDESLAKLWPLTRVCDRYCAREVKPEGQAFVIIACTRGNAAVRVLSR